MEPTLLKYNLSGCISNFYNHYKTVLTVDGMVCSNCSARVENALNELEGVWATADVSAKTVTVLMKALLDEKLLRSTVNELGAYTVMKVENIKN